MSHFSKRYNYLYMLLFFTAALWHIIYRYVCLHGSGIFFYILSTRLLQTLICSFLLCPESRRCATQWSLTIHLDHSQSITCDHSAPVIWVSLEAIGPVGNRCLLKPVEVNHVKLKSEGTLLIRLPSQLPAYCCGMVGLLASVWATFFCRFRLGIDITCHSWYEVLTCRGIFHMADRTIYECPVHVWLRVQYVY